MQIFKILLIILLLFHQNIIGQIKPLDAASRCADRLISDASFELIEVTQKPLVFPLIVDCPEYGSGDKITARGVIIAPVDSVYLTGINSVGPAKVYVTGKLIADVSASLLPFPSEIAYDRYEFQQYFKVALKKGENEVEIKSAGILSLGLSLGIVDEDGFPEKNVSYQVKEYETDAGKVVPEAFKEYKLKVKDGAVFTKQPYTEWNYANSATVFGLMALAEATSNQKYADFAREYCRFSVDNILLFSKQYYQQNSLRGQNYRMFRMAMFDDSSAPALPLIEWLVNGDSSVEARALINKIADYVMKKQTRLEDGTFVRPEPKWTIWGDDLFMSVPFLVRYGSLTGDEHYFDEAAKQITNFDKYLYDAPTGLYYHGWNETKKEHAGFLWGRANGWIAWAISEALLNIPKNHPQYQTLLDIHRRQLETIVKYQDEDGMWHQLLNMPSSYKETSATAIFVMTIARAVREGWIDKKYADNALRGWNAIEKRIDSLGVVSGICSSTSILSDAESYMNQKTLPNDPRGMGAVFMSAVETNKLIEFLSN
ncbi:MAG: glycoside hydrolase family 88 protein [Candidatus Azobacteroides sp.]|nr:glycoside hydrolase family 88 protein [Candidatus Azobacteroides sp.]